MLFSYSPLVMNEGVIHYHSDEKHKLSESPGVVRAERRMPEIIIVTFINAVCFLMQVFSMKIDGYPVHCV